MTDGSEVEAETDRGETEAGAERGRTGLAPAETREEEEEEGRGTPTWFHSARTMAASD